MTAITTVEGRVAGKRVTRLMGLGTALPACELHQKNLVPPTQNMCADTEEQASWVNVVLSRCGVKTKGSVLGVGGVKGLENGNGHEGDNGGAGMTEMERIADIIARRYPSRKDAADRGPTVGERMKWYEEKAPAMAVAAGRRALAAAGVGAGDVTHLVTASCTGFVAPGIDAACVRGLGLGTGIERTHVGFMGCHAAFNSLGVARAIVGAEPRAIVLVCCVELCTLHLGYGWDQQRVVANALFADGAGAVVVGGAESPAAKPGAENLGSGEVSEGEETADTRWELLDRTSLLLPGSEGDMEWRIRDFGFEMTLSQRVPEVVRGCVREGMEGWLAKNGLTIGDVGSWAVHPGGPKVLNAVSEALGLREGALAESYGVLSEHGNMSSPTILFILERLMKKGVPRPYVALGFGPGLSLEGMLLG